MSRGFKIFLGAGLLVAFVVLIEPGLLTVPLTLLVGWWPAGDRLIERWHEQGRTMTWFLIGVIALLLGAHLFIRWFYKGLKPEAEKPAETQGVRQWRMRWTVFGFGVLTCSVLAVISVVLIAHQAYWLRKSNERWFVNKYQSHRRLIAIAARLEGQAEKCYWNPRVLREAFISQDGMLGGEPAWEHIRALWVEKDTNTLQAVFLIQREPSSSNAVWALLRPGTNMTMHPMHELPKVLASYGMANLAAPPSGPVTLLP